MLESNKSVSVLELKNKWHDKNPRFWPLAAKVVELDGRNIRGAFK